MRVLVDYRPALRERTGVGEYVHGLVRALLRSRGRDALTVFTSSWKDRPHADALADLPGVHIVDRRVPVAVLTVAWNRLGWPPVEWLAGPTDVVHAASPLSIPSRAAAQVITIHDLHFMRHPERMSAEMRRDFPGLVRTHAQNADAIVVSSGYTATDVQRTLEVPPERIHLCPPGAPEWAEAVRHRRQTERPEHLLFLGTLDPRKNIGVLLDAYRELRRRVPGAPPLILAGGAPATAGGWQAKAAEAHFAGSVQVTGYVSHTRRLDLLSRAHLLVLPSLDEGFGLPVLEAMACGVPVVVSTGGALPEVAGDAATPVPPADIEGFSRAMEFLLHGEAAGEAARRGLARSQAFDWNATAANVQRAYASAVEHRR